jgi:peptidoglycan/LPS O-acetylase OafA/YrhL
MLSHYLPEHPIACHGGLGVKFFFTLSGFLIGAILIKAKIRIENRSTTLKSELLNFYSRRTLRIFPAYYALLLTCWLLGNWDRTLITWSALYAINIYEVIHTGNSGVFGHLYTLCIEEHLYLIFPFLLLVPKAHKAHHAILFLALGALIYRATFLVASPLHNGSRLLFAELDSLALGAALAWIRQHPTNLNKQLLINLQKWGFLFGLLFGCVALINRLCDHRVTLVVLGPTLFALFSCWVIQNAASHTKGIIGHILAFRPFAWLGAISYGIYLYHNFAAWFTINAASHLDLHLPDQPWLRAMIWIAWSIIAATVSWFILEKPCNSLKRHFTHSEDPVSTKKA